MVTATAAFPGRPFQLRLEAWLVSQDIPGNRSLFHWELWIDKLAYSPTYNNGASSTWNVSCSGQPIASWGPGAFDFRAAGPWLQGSGDQWLSHGADGAPMSPSFQGWASFAMLGDAYVILWVSAPRIPRGPRVFAGGVWRTTVAYVYANGAWRVAVPYVNTGGGAWRIGGG